MNPIQWLSLLGGAPAFAIILILELRSRKLSLVRFSHLSLLGQLDLVPLPLTAVLVMFFVIRLFWLTASTGLFRFNFSVPLSAVFSLVLLALLWSEARKQNQFQRPAGLLFAEWLFFFGLLALANGMLSPEKNGFGNAALLIGVAVACIVVGLLLIALVVPPFVKRYEGLRILETVGDDEQLAQPEYTPPTPECPRPDMWHMLDSQTTEVEVLDLLKAIVTTMKPQLIVETGTFIGHGTIKLAEGARANGFGRVITVEFDPDIRQRAVRRFESTGLSPWIESRLESSLETKIDGTIDLLFSDSHLKNREAEIRRLLPQLNPQGLLVIHDASSYFKLVREAALRLEAEGLISAVFLSTPRGVVLAQRREGRI